jgi:hypothetical protein
MSLSPDEETQQYHEEAFENFWCHPTSCLPQPFTTIISKEAASQDESRSSDETSDDSESLVLAGGRSCRVMMAAGSEVM